MPIKTIKTKSLTWYNIDDPNKEVVDFLRENFNFHALDLKDVLGESQHPKLDTYKNYLFMALHFPEFNSDKSQVVDNEIDIFIGSDFLITIQKKRYKVIKDLFYRVLNNAKLKKEVTSQGSGYLLYRVLEVLYRQSNGVLSYVGRKTRQAENSIFEESKNSVRELALLRRHVLSFKAVLDPQRTVISHLTNMNRAYLPKEMSPYYDDIQDYLNKVLSISKNYKEIIDGLHETNESLISHRTNRTIKALTIMSVALLPLTLLSGIYGMNIEGLPFAGHPNLVWLLYGFVLGIIILTLVYFRKKDLL